MKKLYHIALLCVVCLLFSSCRQSRSPDTSVLTDSQQAIITPVPTFTPTVQMVEQSGDSERVQLEANVVKPSATPTPKQVSISTATATATRQPTATATNQPTSAPMPQYYVNGGANLRRGPGTNFEIVGGLVQGDILSPIARTKDGEWVQIDQDIWIWSGLVEGDVESLPVSYSSDKLSTYGSAATPRPTHTPRPRPTSVPTPNRKATQVALGPSDRRKGFHCLSAWDGNHDGLERVVKRQLKDPSSMKTYETLIAPATEDNKGRLRHYIVMEFGATNSFGAMVRAKAVGWIDHDFCTATLLYIE